MMRALVKSKTEPGLWMEDVPVPEIGRDDALVRVLRTGICGTDHHIYAWDRWAEDHVSVGLVVGHEFVGRVARCGEDVTEFEPGDLVSGEGHIVCGRCRNCKAGRRVECARSQSVGVSRAGAFAEYIAMPAGNLWHHPPSIDLDVAAIFDPFGNAVHVATAFPLLGEDVLITGAGPIGLMAALVARHAGARHIVASDVSVYRRDLAHRLGLTRVIDPTATTLRDVMAGLQMTEGFDVGFEMSGNPAALRQMLAGMRHGGKVALLGLPEAPFEIDWSQLVMNMTTIRGIYGRQIMETWYEMSVLVGAGLDISPVITHRFAADEFDAAFEVVGSAQCGKVILDWSEE
jgi:threonine 3-dehydrogenase